MALFLSHALDARSLVGGGYSVAKPLPTSHSKCVVHLCGSLEHGLDVFGNLGSGGDLLPWFKVEADVRARAELFVANWECLFLL